MTQKKMNKALVLSGLIVLLAGAVMPVLDSSFPKLYGEKSNQELAHQVSAITKNSIVGTNEEQLLEFIETQGGKIMYGRILYPRYVKFNEVDQTGLFLSVLTPEIIEVFIPLSKQPTDNIIGGSDVIVIGCPADGYLTGTLALILDTEEVILSNNPDSLICPIQ